MVVFSPYPADPRPRRAAEALLEEGMSVDLICEGEENSPKREMLNKLELIRLPIQRRRGGMLSYAYQYSAFILASAAILAWRSLRRRYDLVYVHNMPDVLVVSALLPKLFGAKVILDQHDPMPELMRTIFNLDERRLWVRIIARLEKWSMACADLVITVNTRCKAIFGARSCAPRKIGVVMNVPDGNIFPFRTPSLHPSTQGPNKRFVILYHGSIVERNGLDLAVEALERVRTTIPAAELRIVGRSTPFLERVMKDAESKDLNGSLRYIGSRCQEDLIGEIEDCDVGIIPNQHNAFTDINMPTRIFEYLALGKPVIAPRTPGILDYFDEESLILFEPGDAEELAQKIQFVFSHTEGAIETAKRGQQIYLDHTWCQEKQKLVNLVGSLLREDSSQ